MDLTRISRGINVAGKAGALICLLAFLALLDGLVGKFREPASLVKMLPGEVVEINGELVEEVKGVQELATLSDSEQLTVTFETVHKGYFLGGDMWRGRLSAGAGIRPGEYHLNVLPKTSSSTRKAPAFRIVVYPDALSRQKSSTSFIRSYFGVSPFEAAALCLPGILLAFGLVYYLGGKRDALLARSGKAEIYRVLRRDGSYEIHFALGTAHGLGPGMQVRVFDAAGAAVGAARVEEATVTDSLAIATADREIKVGYLVARQ